MSDHRRDLRALADAAEAAYLLGGDEALGAVLRSEQARLCSSSEILDIAVAVKVRQRFGPLVTTKCAHGSPPCYACVSIGEVTVTTMVPTMTLSAALPMVALDASGKRTTLGEIGCPKCGAKRVDLYFDGSGSTCQGCASCRPGLVKT